MNLWAGVTGVDWLVAVAVSLVVCVGMPLAFRRHDDKVAGDRIEVAKRAMLNGADDATVVAILTGEL